MDEQHQSDDPKDKKAAVQTSIRKLREKFVPGVKISLLISAVFNVAMLVIGCLNVHKCPVNKNIPLFLIATGAIALMAKFLTYIKERISHIPVVYLESALYSVELIFFCLGTYWVYREFKPSFDPADGPKYCNKTAYIFAFTYLTVFYAIVIALISGLCCFVCCAILIASQAEVSDLEAPTESSAPLTTQTKNESEAAHVKNEVAEAIP